MPLDLNEVSGFVSSTDNAGYLTDLFNHISDRLNALGVPAPRIERTGLIEGPARSPALAEEPGPDLWSAPPPVAPSLVEEPPASATPEVPPEAAAVVMPDYSRFPAELRQKLETAWKARHGL